jgi:hypothetical protein
MSTFSGTWTEALKPVLDSIRRSDAVEQLEKAARWAKLGADEQKELAEFIVGLAEDAGDFYKGSSLKLDDICKPDRSGFAIETIEDAYQSWRNVPGNELKTPLDYVKVSRGNPGMMIRTLLGELGSGYTWAGRRVASIQNVRWQSLAGLVLAGGEDVATIVRQLNSPQAIEDAVSTAVGVGGDVAGYSDKIGKLIDKLAGGGHALTEDQAAALLGDLEGRAAKGKAVPNFTELVGMLVTGMKSAEDEVEAVGGTVDELLEVEGVENYFRDLVTRSGYATGSLYELRLASERLTALAHDASNPAALLTMQVPMADGRKGFDLGWLTPLADEMTVLQAKSYSDLSKLTKWVKNNELIRQLTSDLRRLKGHVPPFTIDLGAGHTVPVASTMEWRIDWRRLNSSSFATAQELADAEAALKTMTDEVNLKLADPQWRALIGLSPSDPVFQINMILDGAEEL